MLKALNCPVLFFIFIVRNDDNKASYLIHAVIIRYFVDKFGYQPPIPHPLPPPDSRTSLM